MKTGIIDVGGGFRGIYAAGVLDYCMDENIRFDLALGVSAGSANLSSYAAGQRGRNYKFYMEYSFRKEYMSLKNFIFKKSYIDMDYVYGTLCNANGEDPLNYSALRYNTMELFIIATNAKTGEATYFSKSDIQQDNYNIMKASSSIPFFCRPYVINGIPYYDGALSDPVPIKKAFELGCEQVVVILTKPEYELRIPDQDIKLASFICKKYPLAAEKLRNRAYLYNESVVLVQKYIKQGMAFIIAPDDTCGINTLKRNKDSLKRLYEKGYRDGQKIVNYFNK